MITCSYCASELIMENNHAYCSFCDITLGPSSEFGMYSEDGKRIEATKSASLITSDHAKLPVAELCKLNAFDLLLCLKEARRERGFSYNLLRTFNSLDEGNEFAEETGREYEYWTRKCWTIENILINRCGYFPEKINDQLVDKFSEKKDKSLSKQMIIRKSKPVNI